MFGIFICLHFHNEIPEKQNTFLKKKTSQTSPELMSFFCVAALDKTLSHFIKHNGIALGQQQQTLNNPPDIR